MQSIQSSQGTKEIALNDCFLKERQFQVTSLGQVQFSIVGSTTQILYILVLDFTKLFETPYSQCLEYLVFMTIVALARQI